MAYHPDGVPHHVTLQTRFLHLHVGLDVQTDGAAYVRVGVKVNLGDFVAVEKLGERGDSSATEAVQSEVRQRWMAFERPQHGRVGRRVEQDLLCSLRRVPVCVWEFKLVRERLLSDNVRLENTQGRAARPSLENGECQTWSMTMSSTSLYLLAARKKKEQQCHDILVRGEHRGVGHVARCGRHCWGGAVLLFSKPVGFAPIPFPS